MQKLLSKRIVLIRTFRFFSFVGQRLVKFSKKFFPELSNLGKIRLFSTQPNTYLKKIHQTTNFFLIQCE